METYQSLSFTLNGVGLRREQLDGREYLVVPTTMLVEGVLAGSQGPLLYRSEDIRDTPPLWNSKPITLSHPNESASNAAVLNQKRVGICLNTRYDAPKLRTEAWIDIEKANRLDKRLVERLMANQPIEVSTGLYTTNEAVGGVWNGKTYNAIAKNHRPDHLAVLLDMQGASSLADGAGMGVWNNAQLVTPHQMRAWVENQQGMPEHVKSELLATLKTTCQLHDTLVAKILRHPANTFSRELLINSSLEWLQGVDALSGSDEQSVETPKFYSQFNPESEPILDLPSMNFALPGTREYEEQMNPYREQVANEERVSNELARINGEALTRSRQSRQIANHVEPLLDLPAMQFEVAE